MQARFSRQLTRRVADIGRCVVWLGGFVRRVIAALRRRLDVFSCTDEGVGYHTLVRVSDIAVCAEAKRRTHPCMP